MDINELFTDLMDHKECETSDDCTEQSTCQEDRDLRKKVCFCIHDLTPANQYGLCKQDNASDESDHHQRNNTARDIFNVSDIGLGKLNNGPVNSTHAKRAENKTLPLAHESSYNAASAQTLQILIPIISASCVLLVLFFIVSWRIHIYKKRRRKAPGVKSTENVQLLDTMNIINKNPQYMLSIREGSNKGKKYCVAEIPTDQIKIQDVVGEGAFGQVYRGTYVREDGAEGDNIAVKVLKDGVSNEVREDFEREVEIMSAFDHDNILKLLGVVTKGVGETPYMIFEYMIHGDLAELLRRNDPVMRKTNDDFVLQKTDLIDISIQIANGMTYLTSQHFVHRDLATRNCLVGEGLVVKISDFGMARDVYTCDYYRIGGSRMLPVRWMSPESVKYGRFTTESDIWAFGVVLWEIFSFGRQPYYGHSNEEVVRFLDEGILLQRPDECPSTVYHVMLGCWKRDPKERLLFMKIHKHLVDYSKTILRSAHMQSLSIENESQLTI